MMTRQPVAAGRKPIRVLVVDDSRAQRQMLVSLLEADDELEVVGWAADGLAAVRSATTLKPDVITMDLYMPGIDGLETTRRIMHAAPAPIVLVTVCASRKDRVLAYDAMQAGVLAVVAKPGLHAHDRRSTDLLLRTVKSMAQVKVIRHRSTARVVTAPVARAASQPGRPVELVAIGASTGGPQTLLQVLAELPATFTAPILVVQHIAPGFEAGLIDWLGPQCALPMQIARAGQPLNEAGIYVAPVGRHLVVQRGSLTLLDSPARSGHRPSVTVLFESVARAYGAAAAGVLLTGMGDDGAAGLADIKRAGGLTVAQDEASSVVFGMPAVAIGMGVVDHILPPKRIGALLASLPGLAREI